MVKKKFNLPLYEWDSRGKGFSDWSYTLITLINKISKEFHIYDLKGGANLIFIRKDLLNLFVPLEYVRLEGDTYILSGRYDIIIDDNIEENIIIIKQKDTNKIGKIKITNYI
jgi:hypothetical protein